MACFTPTLIYFILYSFPIVYGEVLRLSCRRHGNFSVRYKEKYMTQVNVFDAFSTPTAADCVVKCVGHDTCQHVNYQADVKSCELLDEGEGKLVDKTDCEYLKTEKDEENHGPFCKSVTPCLVTEECFDTCDGRGYRCEKTASLLERNIIVKIVPIISKQWILSFDLKPLGLSNGYASIVHATIGNNALQYGDRIPGIWFIGSSTSLYIGSAINGNIFYAFSSKPLPMKVYTNVKVEQTAVGAQYIFRIYIGGVKVLEVVNTTPSEFTNVILYAADPWYPAAIAAIKNLIFDNQ